MTISPAAPCGTAAYSHVPLADRSSSDLTGDVLNHQLKDQPGGNTDPGDRPNTAYWAFKKDINFHVILADCAAIALPTAFVVFAVSVLLLDGNAIEGSALKKWQNAITVVSFCYGLY